LNRRGKKHDFYVNYHYYIIIYTPTSDQSSYHVRLFSTFFFFFFFLCVLGEPHVQEHSSNISSVLLIFGYFLPSISIYIYILNELEFTCFSVVDRLFFFLLLFLREGQFYKGMYVRESPIWVCVVFMLCTWSVNIIFHHFQVVEFWTFELWQFCFYFDLFSYVVHVLFYIDYVVHVLGLSLIYNFTLVLDLSILLYNPT
jgi:hypothetical protein